MGRTSQQVYGKTGTAQYGNTGNVETDYAWYACFVPATATSKPIVVVVWVEKGGLRRRRRAAPSPARSSRSGSTARPGPYVNGKSSTLAT